MSETFKKFSAKNKFSRKRKESSSSSGTKHSYKLIKIIKGILYFLANNKKSKNFRLCLFINKRKNYFNSQMMIKVNLNHLLFEQIRNQTSQIRMYLKQL